VLNAKLPVGTDEPPLPMVSLSLRLPGNTSLWSLPPLGQPLVAVVAVWHSVLGPDLLASVSKPFRYWGEAPDASNGSVTVCGASDGHAPTAFTSTLTAQLDPDAVCSMWDTRDSRGVHSQGLNATMPINLSSSDTQLQGFGMLLAACSGQEDAVGVEGMDSPRGFGVVVSGVTDIVCGPAPCLAYTAWLTADDGCPEGGDVVGLGPRAEATSSAPLVHFNRSATCRVMLGCGPTTTSRALTVHVVGRNPGTGLASAPLSRRFVVHLAAPRPRNDTAVTAHPGSPSLDVRYDARTHLLHYRCTSEYVDAVHSTQVQYRWMVGVGPGDDSVQRSTVLGTGPQFATGALALPQARHGVVHMLHIMISDRHGLVTSVSAPFTVDFTPPLPRTVSPLTCCVGVERVCLDDVIASPESLGKATKAPPVTAQWLAGTGGNAIGGVAVGQALVAGWASTSSSALGFVDVEQAAFARDAGGNGAPRVLDVGLRIVYRSLFDAFHALGR
jgi:hypothetical protein